MHLIPISSDHRNTDVKIKRKYVFMHWQILERGFQHYLFLLGISVQKWHVIKEIQHVCTEQRRWMHTSLVKPDELTSGSSTSFDQLREINFFLLYTLEVFPMFTVIFVLRKCWLFHSIFQIYTMQRLTKDTKLHKTHMCFNTQTILCSNCINMISQRHWCVIVQL